MSDRDRRMKPDTIYLEMNDYPDPEDPDGHFWSIAARFLHPKQKLEWGIETVWAHEPSPEEVRYAQKVLVEKCRREMA